jgi:hypothetical protein
MSTGRTLMIIQGVKDLTNNSAIMTNKKAMVLCWWAKAHPTHLSPYIVSGGSAKLKAKRIKDFITEDLGSFLTKRGISPYKVSNGYENIFRRHLNGFSYFWV